MVKNKKTQTLIQRKDFKNFKIFIKKNIHQNGIIQTNGIFLRGHFFCYQNAQMIEGMLKKTKKILYKR